MDSAPIHLKFNSYTTPTMSYTINDERLEQLYELVKEQHPSLTEDEQVTLAKELFEAEQWLNGLSITSIASSN